MILLKKILKRKRIISQALYNHSKLEYYYQANNPNICKHAIRELKLAGYGNGKGGPNDWMYQQVIEAIAVFASHGNSGSSAPFEINFVQKICN